jgi:hypothetical protein
MKIKAVLGALSLVGLCFVTGCCCCKNQKSGTAGFTDLFNGKDIDAWNFVLLDPTVQKADVWSVKDGMIVCKGSPVGFISTGPKVKNFRLVVEYRWAPGSKPGNSGIFSRIHEPLKALPSCNEIQLKHGDAGDIMTYQGMTLATNQARFFFVSKHELAGDIFGVRKTMDKEKPAGEWNHVEILARDDRYTVWMNGEKINEATGIEVCEGTIGLQSEGGEVHFRKVSLKPL